MSGEHAAVRDREALYEQSKARDSLVYLDLEIKQRLSVW